MPVIETSGAEVHWRWAAPADDGRPVALLVPGMSSSTESFRSLVEGMGRSRAVLSFDPRGAGLTKSRGGFRIGDIAADAVAVLDAAGVKQCDVLGISMGGMISQELALLAPERVRTLSLACTWAGRRVGVPPSRRTQARLARAILRSRRVSSLEALGDDFAKVLFSPSTSRERRADFFRERLGAPKATLGGIAAQVAAIRRFDTSTRLSGVSVPTAVFVPEDDVLMPSENGPRLASRIPGAVTYDLPGGHVFFWEEREAFLDAIEDHWGAHSP